MATPIYFPRIGALQQPARITAPQDNTLVNALGGGLSAVTSVANNWRQKQQSVEQAQRTADALEREGMTSEANLYRSAADNFSINYFASPEENQKFNKGLISDTLKLLENKQDRDIKQAQLQESIAYKNALLRDRETDNTRQAAEFEFRKEEMGQRREDRTLLNQARIEGKQSEVFSKQQALLNPQLQQNQAAQKALMDARRKGTITQEEFAKQASPLIEQENALYDSMDKLRRAALGEAANGIPSISRGAGRIPVIESEQDEAAKLNAEAAAFAEAEGKKYPSLKELRFRGERIANPYYVGGSTTNITGQDAEGRPYSRSTTTTPGAPSIKPGPPLDPGLFKASGIK